MTQLVVIEAPGKLRSVRAGLAGTGLPIEAVATLGHLQRYAAFLQPLGIERGADGRLHETRQATRPNVRKFVGDAMRRADRIVIATDADQEGHAIADDVAAMAAIEAPGIPVVRMLPQGMDPESLLRAWAGIGPLRPEAAQAGIARRMADRVFAAGNGAIGRVQAALLTLCAAGKVATRIAKVPLPATDSGAPFIATLALPPGVGLAQAKSALEALGPIDPLPARVESLGRPPDGVDVLLAMERDAGIGIDAAALLLQELYETGRISYPRSEERAYTGFGVEAVTRLAQARAVLSFQAGRVAQLDAGFAGHEAVRVLGQDVDLLRPPRLAKTQGEAALTVIGRLALEAGVPVKRELGQAAGDVPDWLAGVSLARDSTLARLPWGSAPVDTARLVERSPTAAVVAALAEAGVGRPSTVARHAQRWMASGFTDDALQLTERGEAALAAVPRHVREATLSGAFEHAIEQGEPVEERVANALAALDAADAWNAISARAGVGGEPNAEHSASDEAAPASGASCAAEIPEYEDEEDVPAYRLGG